MATERGQQIWKTSTYLCCNMAKCTLCLTAPMLSYSPLPRSTRQDGSEITIRLPPLAAPPIFKSESVVPADHYHAALPVSVAPQQAAPVNLAGSNNGLGNRGPCNVLTQAAVGIEVNNAPSLTRNAAISGVNQSFSSVPANILAPTVAAPARNAEPPQNNPTAGHSAALTNRILPTSQRLFALHDSPNPHAQFQHTRDAGAPSNAASSAPSNQSERQPLYVPIWALAAPTPNTQDRTLTQTNPSFRRYSTPPPEPKHPRSLYPPDVYHKRTCEYLESLTRTIYHICNTVCNRSFSLYHDSVPRRHAFLYQEAAQIAAVGLRSHHESHPAGIASLPDFVTRRIALYRAYMTLYNLLDRLMMRQLTMLEWKVKNHAMLAHREEKLWEEHSRQFNFLKDLKVTFVLNLKTEDERDEERDQGESHRRSQGNDVAWPRFMASDVLDEWRAES